MLSLLMTKFVSLPLIWVSEIKYSCRYFNVPALDGDLMGRGLLFFICHSFYTNFVHLPRLSVSLTKSGFTGYDSPGPFCKCSDNEYT